MATIAPGSPSLRGSLYHSIAWPASRGHPIPLAYLRASSVISAGVFGSGKTDCPAAWSTRQGNAIAMTSDERKIRISSPSEGAHRVSSGT